MQHLSLVNHAFHSALIDATVSKLIYFDDDLLHYFRVGKKSLLTLLDNRIIRRTGSQSSIGLKIRSILQPNKWFNAWLVLERVDIMGPGW